MFNLSAWLVAPKPDFSSSSKTFTAIWRRIQWSASTAKEHGIASCEIKLGSTFKPIPCLNSIKGKTWFHQPALAYSSMLIRPDTRMWANQPGEDRIVNSFLENLWRIGSPIFFQQQHPQSANHRVGDIEWLWLKIRGSSKASQILDACVNIKDTLSLANSVCARSRNCIYIYMTYWVLLPPS